MTGWAPSWTQGGSQPRAACHMSMSAFTAAQPGQADLRHIPAAASAADTCAREDRARRALQLQSQTRSGRGPGGSSPQYTAGGRGHPPSLALRHLGPWGHEPVARSCLGSAATGALVRTP